MSSAIERSMVDGEGSERRVRLETWWGIIDRWAKNREVSLWLGGQSFATLQQRFSPGRELEEDEANDGSGRREAISGVEMGFCLSAAGR